MPQNEGLRASEGAVGGLAFEYENQYLSAFDRTVRACPWLGRIEPDEFFAMRPFHKDARTVVAREAGFRSWSELVASFGVPEETYWSQCDPNELTALGQGGSFHFEGSELDRGIVVRCCLWLCLARRFDLVSEFCQAARGLESQATPSLLKRLVEADAPCPAVETALKAGVPSDFADAAQSAYRLGRDDLIELITGLGPLPPIDQLDELLRSCTLGELEKAEGLAARDPLIWVRRKEAVWAMAAIWAETGHSRALEMALRVGLSFPKLPPTWRSPLHAAAWFGDPRSLEVGLHLGCPINGLDQRNSSSPLGWIVRSLLLLPPVTNPFNNPDKAACARLLVSRGAIVMPGYLACPCPGWLEDLVPGI